MFLQIISGKKDMTRRVSYVPFFLDCNNHTSEYFQKKKYYGKPTEYVLGVDGVISCGHCNQAGVFVAKPRYKVGETVYLKEPFMVTDCVKVGDKYRVSVEYKYKKAKSSIFINENYKGGYNKWISPRFMPSWAARYFVSISDVRAEKLHTISNEDCIREGVEYVIPRLKAKSIKRNMPVMPLGYSMDVHYRDYSSLRSKRKDSKPEFKFLNPKDSFISLWNVINGAKNPFHLNADVFMYIFKLKKLKK